MSSFFDDRNWREIEPGQDNFWEERCKGLEKLLPAIVTGKL